MKLRDLSDVYANPDLVDTESGEKRKATRRIERRDRMRRRGLRYKLRALKFCNASLLMLRQSIGTILVLLGLGCVSAFFWLTFGYPAGILTVGVSLILMGVGIERDREENSDGIRKGADSSR